MYYPYQKGRYEVAPGLLPFGKDFGNGDVDQRLFQVGDDFPIYREQIELNRAREPVEKYVCEAKDTDPAAVGAIAAFMARKFAEEYPSKVRITHGAGGAEFHFENDFTGDSFVLVPAKNTVHDVKSKIKFVSGWDAVGAQVPEDLAIWKMNVDSASAPVSENMEALHLNAPNHWAAQDKVGQTFAAVHAPVAHIEKITPWAMNILDGILKKGPYVRFAWGVGTDNRLNHHPEVAPDVIDKEWHGRSFDPAEPRLYARVERQALWGFQDLHRALFTIRTYFHDMSELKKTRPEAVSGLIEAILGMSPESLQYKGLTHHRDQVVAWLRS